MKFIFVLLSLFLNQGASGADTDRVSVMEGDSVTLHPCVKKNQQYTIRWYFNDIRIAQISGDLSKTCTDVQCNNDTGRFRDRLKLDHQTGSLTIMNITDTDSGEYTLKISSSSSDSGKIYSVSVHEVKRKSVKEGESVTLVSDVKRNPNDVMWHFNDIRITGDQRKICTDVQCKERFRDRLKLDHQTGSLTIMNTRNTDSGLYKLQSISISNRHRRSASNNNNNIEIFKVTVIGAGLPDSGSSAGVVAGIVVGVLLVSAAAVAFSVMYLRHRRNVWEEGELTVFDVGPINEMEKDRGHVI